MPLKAGDWLDGRYRIIRTLGRGGEGSVYLAVQERIYKFYAVKVVEKREECFSKESVELWKRLSHPGLPEIVDVLETEQELCLVMEYVEGRTLEEVLDQQGIPGMRLIISWGIQICEILEYLHGQNPPIIFGDVKPSNLVLQKDRIILVDLGSSMLLNSKGRKSGTLEYLPPQQEQKEVTVDIYLDLYGLGKTLGFLAAGGRKCSNGSDDWNLKGISGELQKILEKCTASKVSQRYCDVRECRLALEKLQSRPWFLGAMVVLSLCVMAAAGETMKQEQNTVDATVQYEQLIQEARNSTFQDQRELLAEAIRLNPSCETGYLDFIENLLEDNCLSEKEDVELRRVLLESEGNGISCEEKLQGNQSGYGEVAYEIGMAYWYFYEGEGGKNYAVRWFQKVLQLPEESFDYPEKRAKCRIYEKIGGYRLELEHGDRTGEMAVSFQEYWEDLMDLFQISEKEAESTAVTLYFWQELLLQMTHYRLEFQNEGVTEEQMKDVAETIETELKIIQDSSKVVKQRKEQIQLLLDVIKEDWDESD